MPPYNYLTAKTVTSDYDFEIWQMDMKTIFLNGNLDEEVYMIQPEGFISKESPNKVCRLLRSIMLNLGF